MIVDDFYPYKVSPDKTLFAFTSIGKQGEISKVIVFSYMKYRRRWNLGFGDYVAGKVEDKVVSNNHDLRKVISTVVMAAYLFCQTYPNRSIFIRPVDEKRKVLYNAIFQKRHLEIELNFKIIGRRKGKREPYDPDKTFDEFEIFPLRY